MTTRDPLRQRGEGMRLDGVVPGVVNEDIRRRPQRVFHGAAMRTPAGARPSASPMSLPACCARDGPSERELSGREDLACHGGASPAGRPGDTDTNRHRAHFPLSAETNRF